MLCIESCVFRKELFIVHKGPDNLFISFQSLRGPRGGMIFFKKDNVLGVDLESAINNAVFPGLQVTCTFFARSHHTCRLGAIWFQVI